MKNDLVESFSGIRGIYGESMNESLAYQYAYSYCQLFKPHSLIIAGDTRKSTPILKKAMIRAFQDCGIEKIIDAGIIPVQVCEYGVQKFKADGGVYISASHNEPEYNGFKFLKKDGALLYQDQINSLIKEVYKNQEYVTKDNKTKIIDKEKEIIDNYIDFVLERVGKTKTKGLRILIDPNGGSGIAVLKRLFAKLGVQAEIINNQMGEFKRLIEPNDQSLKYLQKELKDESFACGFDCDADRVVIVLKDQIVSGQYVLALACDSLLEGTKDQIVVTNDCTSYLVRDIIKNHGATMKEVEVGEMNVVSEMEKQGSIIGGEGSCGGVIIPPIKCRDGIMTVCLILKMMADKKKSLDGILDDYPKYFSERAKLTCSSDKVFGIKDKIEKYFDKFEMKKTGGSTGGLKILIDKSLYIWFRQSKTEAGTFRIIVDGDNQKKVKELLNQGVKLFNKFK
ncbi:hypothetical protein KKC65_01290 [Patescibacteria group bacterium]|nr:hypothetical protein [Patescibacteria group bacterium]